MDKTEAKNEIAGMLSAATLMLISLVGWVLFIPFALVCMAIYLYENKDHVWHWYTVMHVFFYTVMAPFYMPMRGYLWLFEKVRYYFERNIHIW